MAQTGGGAVEAGCAQPQTELEFRIVWAVSAQNGTLWCAVERCGDGCIHQINSYDLERKFYQCTAWA